MDIKKVIDFEINFPSKFADVVERLYGKLFYNLDNTISHDSNHGVITDLSRDLDQALSEIESFYREKGLSPRIYPAFLPGEEETLKPFLAKHGFTYQKYDNLYFLWQDDSKLIPNRKLEIKRLLEIDDQIIEIIRSEDKGDWAINVLKRNIQAESFHFLAGYVQGKAVAMASLNMIEGLSRVDDVITHKNYRGQGYCSTLIHYLVDYHRRISNNLLYLYSAEPKAIKIYRKAGFAEFKEQLSSWSAWLE